MAKVNTSVSINAPLEKVFDYTASPINGPVFIPNLNENTNVSVNPTELGQTWDWRYNMAGVDVRGSAEVTTMDRPNKFSLKTTGGVDSQWTYTFTSENNGTNVTLEIEYEVPQTVLGKMSAQIVENLNQKNADQGLQNLKTILESE